MSLTEKYIEYLSRRADQATVRRMAEALAASGYGIEAALLHHLAAHGPGSTRLARPDSPFDGLPVHLGESLPAQADVGDLWFDPCELTAMILVPRIPDEDEDAAPGSPEPYAWLALRSVAQWQCAAFLQLASRKSRTVQVAPPFALLEPARLLSGPEDAPVTRLTCGEAIMCARWFGKGVPSQLIFQWAAKSVPPPAFAQLLSEPAGEWAGYSGFDEGLCEVVTRQNLWLDPQEEAEQEQAVAPERRMLYGEWARPAAVSFRTAVLCQLGLLRTLGPDPLSFHDVYVAAPLQRAS